MSTHGARRSPLQVLHLIGTSQSAPRSKKGPFLALEIVQVFYTHDATHLLFLGAGRKDGFKVAKLLVPLEELRIWLFCGSSSFQLGFGGVWYFQQFRTVSVW